MECWVKEEGNAVAFLVARCADAVQRRAEAPIGPPARIARTAGGVRITHSWQGTQSTRATLSPWLLRVDSSIRMTEKQARSEQGKGSPRSLRHLSDSDAHLSGM